MPKVNTEGLKPSQVLIALYSASRPQGMGFLAYDKTPMTEQEAEAELATSTYFDYLKGRVMKVDLSDPAGFDPWGYDRDNGQGAAQAAIDAIRNNTPDVISDIHEFGKSQAKEQARAMMGTPAEQRIDDGVVVQTMTLSDVKDVLAPVVDRA